MPSHLVDRLFDQGSPPDSDTDALLDLKKAVLSDTIEQDVDGMVRLPFDGLTDTT